MEAIFALIVIAASTLAVVVARGRAAALLRGRPNLERPYNGRRGAAGWRRADH